MQIDDHAFPFQLDTGSDSDFLYGTLADEAGWSSLHQTTFQPHTLRIAATIIDRPQIHILRNQPDSEAIKGTLGLPSLIGRVAVVDYPDRRFCLFNNADVPPQLRAGFAVKGALRNGSFLIPMQAGSFKSDSIIFDTGSSSLPLQVDPVNWRRITGKAEPEKAPSKYEGWAWGKPVVFFGAPAESELYVGAIGLGKPFVFTKQGTVEQFGNGADGIMGNAAFWNGIVVLDLTNSVQFRYIQ